MPQPLLIVGASVRAAAQCARRAGFAPLCVDLFADVDLQRIAPTRRALPFPRAVPEIAAQLPAAPVMWTGAMENHIDTLRKLAVERRLLGSSPEALSAVRNPTLVASALRRNGVPTPEVRMDPSSLPADGSWLVKPYLGSAGKGIRCWNGNATNDQGIERSYYQQALKGQSSSAVFVAAQGQATLLGSTTQLVGTPWLHTAPYSYAGSIGPLSLDAETKIAWEHIGGVLASEFQLVGLFGVDAIISDGTVCPVEVNPRFTASVEILERAFSINTIRYHVDACRDARLPQWTMSDPQGCFGKAILYASRDCIAPDALLQFADRQNAAATWPTVADIPEPGTRIRCSMPITTLFASGTDPQAVLVHLRQLASDVEQLIDNG